MTRALVTSIFLAAASVGCVAPGAAQHTSARSVGDDVCLDASRTSGDAPAGAATGCMGLSVDSPGWNEAFDLHVCGPCAFTYDDAATRRERASGHAHDCCYHARSPSPPVPPGGPRS